MERRFHCLANVLAFALAIFAGTFSPPAVACFCDCSIYSSPKQDPTATPFRTADYDQIFSGLVISSERTDEPVSTAAPEEWETASGERVMVSPGYWTRSSILVLRIWKGAPSPVAEVWTPVESDCESPPIPSFNFVALVRTEKGRSVAGNSLCDCAQRAAATEGRGAYTALGIPFIAAAIFAAAIALLSLVKVVRRRRPSA
jgi:hypothetical protein